MGWVSEGVSVVQPAAERDRRLRTTKSEAVAFGNMDYHSLDQEVRHMTRVVLELFRTIDCHAKIGPRQNWSPPPKLVPRTNFGSQNWSGGPVLATKIGLPRPILAAKSGLPWIKLVPPRTSFGCQKWSPRPAQSVLWIDLKCFSS